MVLPSPRPQPGGCGDDGGCCCCDEDDGGGAWGVTPLGVLYAILCQAMSSQDAYFLATAQHDALVQYMITHPRPENATKTMIGHVAKDNVLEWTPGLDTSEAWY